MIQAVVDKYLENYAKRKRVTEMTRTEIKTKAQEEIMDKLSTISYGIREKGTYNEQESEILMMEIKIQMDRVAKLMGFETSYFS